MKLRLGVRAASCVFIPDNMVLSPDMQVTKEVRQPGNSIKLIKGEIAQEMDNIKQMHKTKPNVFSYNSEAVLIPNVTQCYLFQPAIPMCVLQ